MRIPSPAECGLPPKFTHWRANQQEAIRLLLTSTRRVKALCAPTGFGKSPAVIAGALLSGLPTCIVTNNRALQDQYMEDYASIGLVDIRGRRNYTCDLREDYTCEDGYAARCPYKGTIACPASQAEMRAASSPLVVTNYDKWTSARKFGTGMAHFQQVVFDEGHEAPHKLADAVQVTLHHREVHEHLRRDFPEDPLVFESWKAWAHEAKETATLAMQDAHERIRDGEAKASWIRHFTHMRNLVRRLSVLSTASATHWVVDETRDGYQFDPVHPGRYSESHLLLRVPSIIVVSATLRPKTLYMMGIGKAAFDFKEFNSDFDPKRCPIYYVPTMRVDKRADDLSQLWLRLDQIAARRTDRKGIVHTISYARRDQILNASRFHDAMLVNEQGEASTETVETFKLSPDGTILVSPSVGAGFDFPGRQCEWQFVCKVPFPDGRSKILQARQLADPEYGPYLAMNSLVQTFGRGMRSREDQCENFIADDHLEWFLPRYAHLAPKSFHGFFRRVTVLPQPPPRLEG